jgi:DNA helicase-2/ATP-dependent DNA helicase PcrA
MNLLEGLTPEQTEAVLHRDGPLLIVAGAGSGKTRVVTRRIARLVHSGVPRDSVLAITFTNKAAGEMRERVLELVPRVRTSARTNAKAAATGPWISTFHSFAVKLLREHAPLLGFGKDFSILDEDDQLALVREAAIAARVDVEKLRPPLLAHAIGRAKERLDDAAFAASAQSPLEKAAARILPIYRQRARERNAFDFDDLVASVVLLLEGRSDLREELNDRLRYVSIDEYQDTNHAQYRLARLLAGKRKNLVVVGDPDQSIYGWRGADMRNILRFEEDYPEARVIRLEKNYRSSATILKASNALIAKNSERREKQLVPTAGDGAPIEVMRALDEDYEAAWVAARVQLAIQLGTKPSEVAVIYRANALSRRYEDALLKKGIPFATVGSPSFFERREVKDTLAYLRMAANPRDDLAALRALKTPPRGLGARTFEKLHERQRERSTTFVEACEQAGEIPGLSPHARAALEGFGKLARELERGASGSVESLVRTALTRTAFESHLLATDEKGKERCDNLSALVDAAREADARGGEGGARGFLEGLALRDAQDDKDDTRERVTLTTIHAAKGLEFDVVICVGLEEGLFPHQRALDEGQIEEERRLAYVAFTRARKQLVLTYASVRGARASTERRSASTFLLELPRELLWDPERKKLPDLVAPEPAAKPVHASLPVAARAASVLATVPMAEVVSTAGKVPLWKRGLTGASPASR